MKILSNIHDYIFSKLIIYTKLIQWLNIQTTIPFGNQIFNYFKKFTNKSPYINDDISHINFYELENKYGIEIEKIPINSGTISVVFKAKMNDKDIVLKIKRNGIDTKIKNTINNIKIISFFIEQYIYKNINLFNFIYNLEDKFNEQTNFIKEIDNIIIFKEKIHHKLIEPLIVYPDISNDNIIIMDYIKGKTIYELNAEEKDKFGKIYLKTFMYLLFVKNIAHLDLHPGNLLFKDNKIIYLDLGLIYFIEDVEYTDYIFNIFCTFIYSDINYLINSIKNYKHKLYLEYDDEKIETLIENLQKIDLLSNKSNLVFLSKVILEIMKYTKKSGIIPVKNINQLMLFLITNISVIHFFTDGNAEYLFKSLEDEILKFG